MLGFEVGAFDSFFVDGCNVGFKVGILTSDGSLVGLVSISIIFEDVPSPFKLGFNVFGL